MHPGTPVWAPEEVDFALNELLKEFSDESRERISTVVQSASSFLPVTAGGMAFIQWAHKRLPGQCLIQLSHELLPVERFEQ